MAGFKKLSASLSAPFRGTEADALDRASPVPLYYQLARHLEVQVRSGLYRTHEKFPTEEDLIATFQVSAPVVRQALALLVEQGLLVRERGRGTFVRPGARWADPGKRATKYHRIGLIMPWGANTFFAPLLETVEEISHEAGFQVLLVNNREDPQVEIAKVREMLDHGVDGVLWMCPTKGPNEALVRRVLRSVPAVAIDRAVEIDGVEMSLVEADNVGGMKQVVRYLLGKGHRRIAFVREALRVSSARERALGYHEALKESGVDVSDAWVFSSRRLFYENGRTCAERILQSAVKFDAICCHTDDTAVGVLHVLHERGVKVPEDLAVTGFNDSAEATVVRPQLTTARIDVREMGRRAGRLLLKQLESRDAGEPIAPQRITVPVDLVIRESA